MGFKYFCGQKSADGDTSSYRRNAAGGIYRPTWLIRTSDWEKVHGNEASNGYCALSYCWSQAYEAIQGDGGKSDYIDNARHTVVVPNNNKNELVTFEVMLAQICIDFDIDYLWYDKLCVDQSNDEQKLQEIQQMHRIYSNARYTVVIVPEMEIADDMDCSRYIRPGVTIARAKVMTEVIESQWWKRSWTLLEMVMSKRMLLVGSNTHVWQEKLNSQSAFLGDEFGFMLAFDTKQYKSTNHILSHAHGRTSAIEHDKFLAMANILHDVIRDLPFSYDNTISTIANSLYRQIAEHDLSILCFGLCRKIPGAPFSSKRTMDAYRLPSWAGANGYHIPHETIVVSLLESEHFVDENMALHLNGRYRIVRPIRFEQQDQWSDGELLERFQKHHANRATQTPLPAFQTPPSMDENRLDMFYATVGCYSTHYYMEGSDDQVIPVLLSLTEDCDQDVILLPILFDCCGTSGTPMVMRHAHVYLVPVVKEICDAETSTYRAVGVAYCGSSRPDFARPHPVRLLEQIISAEGLNEPKLFELH
ncbi:heterokaryon incompatibility protein-domain-containing protein [Fennellomyces sp. T-0311]|nr:heterokaryon incompatibility protein-domain-containing protein [Fennellomyces sp. T-0311]